MKPANEQSFTISCKKIGRRKFIDTSVVGGISFLCLPALAGNFFSGREKLKYDLSLDSPARYFDGESCFVHPRAGIVPGAGKNGLPR
ncbi:MAG: hypothetical protein GX820_06025, partial [Bacteroidales bacterium]|nr:hypothetical protein [Bacteroidales bacterium]